MTTIQLRRGTSAQWAAANPVLAAGEPGWDLTTSTLKIGDGTRRWSDLSPVHLGALEGPVGTAVARQAALVAEGGHRQAWDAVATLSRVKPVRILYLGSSTTYGNNATTDEARYINQTTRRAQAQFPAPGGDEASVRLLSAAHASPWQKAGIEGINGWAGQGTAATYCPSLTLSVAQTLNVSFAVHMIGSNDSVANVALSTYRDHVRTAVSGLASRGVKGQLLVHTFRRDGVSVAKWAQYRQMLQEVAAEVDGVGVLDVSGVYEGLNHLGADPLDLIDTDGVHMTNAGHALMGELVARALGVTARPLLQSRPAPHLVSVGTVHIDAGTSKPLFSTGTAWVDADGVER